MQMKNVLVAATFVLAAAQADARPSFPAEIPNGNVNSCLNCHNSSAGGARNAFGSAWDAGGWSGICDRDTDGDGQTNGQELGDPDCIWTRGATPARTTDVSNPSQSSSTSADPNGGSTAAGEGEGEGEAGEGEGEGEGDAGEGEGEGEGGGCAGAGVGLPVALAALLRRRRR